MTTMPARAPAATTPLVELVVTEELVAPAAARLHALITDAFALRPSRLVIDLTACPFMDALAIDVLLSAHRKAWQLGCRLELRSPSQRLLRIFHVAHVDQVFDISFRRPARHAVEEPTERPR